MQSLNGSFIKGSIGLLCLLTLASSLAFAERWHEVYKGNDFAVSIDEESIKKNAEGLREFTAERVTMDAFLAGMDTFTSVTDCKTRKMKKQKLLIDDGHWSALPNPQWEGPDEMTNIYLNFVCRK